MLYVLIAILVILDQISKYMITQNLTLMEIRPVIEGFFSITYFQNSGGAFSFLAETEWGIIVLSAISVTVSVILLYVLYKLRNNKMFWIRFSIALLVSGTIGNMIDRIRVKAVVDFLMFTFGKYTFPIFNVADICIVAGSILLALLLIFDKRLFSTDGNKTADNLTVDADTLEGKSSKNDL